MRQPRQWMLLSLFAAMLVILGASAVAVYLMGLTVVRSGRTIDEHLGEIADLEGYLSALKDVETGERGYLLRGNETYLEPYKTGVNDTHRRTAALRGWVRQGDLSKDDIDELARLADEKLAAAELAVQQRRTDDLERGKQIMDEARAKVEGLTNRERGHLATARNKADEATTERTVVFLACGVINLIFLMWAYRLLRSAMLDRAAAAADYQRFSEQLTALHELNIALQQESTVDGLCRAAVEQGRARLGFDRLGLFFHDGDDFVVGTYGTDEHGELRDERTVRLPLGQTPDFARIRAGQLRSALDLEADLLDERSHRVGHGAHVAAAMWAGRQIVGYAVADNLLRHEPLDDRRRQLLELFASAVGELWARLRAEERTAWLASFPRLNPFPIVEADLEGKIHYVNPAAEQLFPDMKVGMSGYPWLADWGAVVEGFRQSGAPGTVREVIVGGRWYQQLLAYAAPEHVIRIYGLDITERKHAEETLRRTAEELARSNQDLEQFAYVASHDLQEPLRMVTGFMQLFEQKYRGQLDAQADQFIAYAVDGAKRMQQLINDLLTYSRVGRGREPAPTDTGKALDDALANLRASIEKSGATVTHADLPAVKGDRGQLVQLFQNLIGNALKFHGQEPPRIRVEARREEKQWVFSVADNGIGIEPQYHAKIFEIFQRLHRRGEYPGTGIGLAICKKIVDRHGGRIWVQSTLGGGSTFFFSVPM